LPQSANPDARLIAVDQTLRELESLCGRMERALVKRNWEEIESGIVDARRVTHALQNAMEDAAPVRTRAFDDHVLQRLRYIGAIRDNQMKRLQQYQAAVGERLQLLGRWRSALRSITSRGAFGASLNDVR
jgi:hypothetical protein